MNKIYAFKYLIWLNHADFKTPIATQRVQWSTGIPVYLAGYVKKNLNADRCLPTYKDYD